MRLTLRAERRFEAHFPSPNGSEIGCLVFLRTHVPPDVPEFLMVERDLRNAYSVNGQGLYPQVNPQTAGWWQISNMQS